MSRKCYQIVLLSNYFLGPFLSHCRWDSVAAVRLEKETSLSAFFIVFATIMACLFMIQFTVVFPNLRFDRGFLQMTKHACLQPPTEILLMTAIFRVPCWHSYSWSKNWTTCQNLGIHTIKWTRPSPSIFAYCKQSKKWAVGKSGNEVMYLSKPHIGVVYKENWSNQQTDQIATK